MTAEEQYDVGRDGSPATRRPEATEVEQHGIEDHARASAHRIRTGGGVGR